MIEPNETPEAAAIRGTLEETGCRSAIRNLSANSCRPGGHIMACKQEARKLKWRLKIVEIPEQTYDLTLG